jgi:lambda family phage portal protein
MARARQLVSSNALAASGAEAWVSGLIGPGITGKSTHPGIRLRKQLDTAWQRFADDADADGRLDFGGLQSLIIRRVVVDGEAIVLLVNRGGRLRLRVLPSEALSTESREMGNGFVLREGIELDPLGNRLAYRLYADAPGALPRAVPIRVPAQDVLHIFNPAYPGQLRGISWFAPVLLSIAEHAKLSDAALMQQQVSAMLTGFIRDPSGQPAMFGGSDIKDGALVPSLEPGSMVTLEPSQDVTFTKPPAATGQRDVLTLSARQIAAGLGVPYEVLTGDLTSVNYSSIRAGLVEWRRRCEAMQYGFILHQFLRPAYARFVATEALSGRIYLQGDPLNYQAEWYAPKVAWVDPQKDCAAEVLAIENGLMSRTEALAQRGWRAEDVDQQIANDKAREAALGLNFNNPRQQ